LRFTLRAARIHIHPLFSLSCSTRRQPLSGLNFESKLSPAGASAPLFLCAFFFAHGRARVMWVRVLRPKLICIRDLHIKAGVCVLCCVPSALRIFHGHKQHFLAGWAREAGWLGLAGRARRLTRIRVATPLRPSPHQPADLCVHCGLQAPG
jgi:hypothetical protein